MRKKTIATVLILLLVVSLGAFFRISAKRSDEGPGLCPFCDELIVGKQRCFEDDYVTVLYTHKPIVPCHFLVLPKRHVEHFDGLLEVEMKHIQGAIGKLVESSRKSLQISSYFLVQKNGKEAGQSVPHVHFHFIGKRYGDDSSTKLLMKTLWAQLRGPISLEQIKEMTSRIGKAMELGHSTAIDQNVGKN